MRILWAPATSKATERTKQNKKACQNPSKSISKTKGLFIKYLKALGYCCSPHPRCGPDPQRHSGSWKVCVPSYWERKRKAGGKFWKLGFLGDTAEQLSEKDVPGFDSNRPWRSSKGHFRVGRSGNGYLHFGDLFGIAFQNLKCVYTL